MTSLLFFLLGVLFGGIIVWLYIKNTHLLKFNRLLERNRQDRVEHNVDSYQIDETHTRVQNMESHLEEEQTDRDEGVKHRDRHE